MSSLSLFNGVPDKYLKTVSGERMISLDGMKYLKNTTADMKIWWKLKFLIKAIEEDQKK